MKTIFFETLTLTFIIFTLTGCSPSRSNKLHLVCERVISHKNCSLIIHSEPHDYPQPNPPWHIPSTKTITKFSFHCRGSGGYSEETKQYDCLGWYYHPLPKKENKEHIYPSIIDFTRYLSKHIPYLKILEGHTCYKHYHYLSTQNIHLNPKHLIGAATILETSSYLELDELHLLLEKKYSPYFLKNNPEYIFSKIDRFTIENKNLKVKIKHINQQTIISLEALFDEDNQSIIMMPKLPHQENYLR